MSGNMGQRAPSSLIPRFTGLAGTLPQGLLAVIPIAEPPSSPPK